MEGAFMKKRYVAGMLIALVALVSSAVILVLSNDIPVNSTSLRYTYSIVNMYPHDRNAFTQGLVFENGFLYESTGLKASFS